MIIQPTTATLAELLRAELRRLPEQPADAQAPLLALADGLLGVVARRAQSESAWMTQEIADVVDLAAFLVQEGLGGEDGLAEAAARCSAEGGPEMLADRYRAASALLADCVPLAMAAGGEARARLEAVVDTRLAHEQAIRGDLQLQRG